MMQARVGARRVGLVLVITITAIGYAEARVATVMCPENSESDTSANSNPPRLGNGSQRRKVMLPRLEDFPIPEGVQVDSTWGEQMIEMADFIGAYHTLLISERFGGEYLYVPRNEAASPVRDLLGHNLSCVFTDCYGGQRVAIAVASSVIRRARRAGVLAGVRAGLISGGDAAFVLRTSRSYLSHLLNGTDEGVGVTACAMPERGDVRLLRQAAATAAEALRVVGAPDDLIVVTKFEITSLADGQRHPLGQVYESRATPEGE